MGVNAVLWRGIGLSLEVDLLTALFDAAVMVHDVFVGFLPEPLAKLLLELDFGQVMVVVQLSSRFDPGLG